MDKNKIMKKTYIYVRYLIRADQWKFSRVGSVTTNTPGRKLLGGELRLTNRWNSSNLQV